MATLPQTIGLAEQLTSYAKCICNVQWIDSVIRSIAIDVDAIDQCFLHGLEYLCREYSIILYYGDNIAL
jgi:hypothetical protein